MKFKKILVNNKENLEFLNSLEKIYMVGYWAHYGTRDFPFIGKFENKSGYYFPIVYRYNDHNGTADQWELVSLRETTTGGIVCWSSSETMAKKIAAALNEQKSI